MSIGSPTQHCVTRFTSKAECVATAQSTKTVLVLNPYIVGRPIDVFEDDQGAIAMAENPISGGCIRH